MKDYSIIIEKLMDGIITILEESYDYGYDQGYADAKSELGQNAIDLAHEESDRAYQQGLEDAWKFIQKLLKDECDGGYTVSLLQNALGYCNIRNIVCYYGISEALAKIKAYEDKQKQDTEIKVGDEVVYDGGKYIVTIIANSGSSYTMISADGSHIWRVSRDDITVTGRHFDQIAEVLAEMRGDKE